MIEIIILIIIGCIVYSCMIEFGKSLDNIEEKTNLIVSDLEDINKRLDKLIKNCDKLIKSCKIN